MTLTRTFSGISAAAQNLSVWHEEEFASTEADIFAIDLRRSSDSFWYNFATKAFQSGYAQIVVPRSVGRAGRFTTPVYTTTTGTHTLRFIMASGALNGDKIRLYQTQATVDGVFVHTDMPTSSLLGSGDDHASGGGYLAYQQDYSVTGRQTFNPQRGTNRFTLEVEQDGSWDWSAAPASDTVGIFGWNEGLFHTLGTEPNHYDIVWLNQTTPGTVKLMFGRFRTKVTSGGVAEATFPSFDPGDVFEIAVRWTGDSPGGELGLPDLTASVFIDGVKGTDAVFGSAHTAGGVDTELWVGCVFNDGAVLKRRTAFNWIRNWDMSTRALPDDRMLAGR